MVKYDTDMYNFMLLFLLQGNNIIGFIIYYLMLSKAFCCSFPQTKLLSFLSRSNCEKEDTHTICIILKPPLNLILESVNEPYFIHKGNQESFTNIEQKLCTNFSLFSSHFLFFIASMRKCDIALFAYQQKWRKIHAFTFNQHACISFSKTKKLTQPSVHNQQDDFPVLILNPWELLKDNGALKIKSNRVEKGSEWHERQDGSYAIGCNNYVVNRGRASIRHRN